MRKTATKLNLHNFFKIIVFWGILFTHAFAQEQNNSVKFVNDFVAEVSLDISVVKTDFALKIVCDKGKAIVKNITLDDKSLILVKQISQTGQDEEGQYTFDQSSDQKTALLNIAINKTDGKFTVYLLLMKTAGTDANIELFIDDKIQSIYRLDYSTKKLEEIIR